MRLWCSGLNGRKGEYWNYLPAVLLENIWSFQNAPTLEHFVRENDLLIFGPNSESSNVTASHGNPNEALRCMRNLVNVHVNNAFKTVAALEAHLDDVDFMNPERLRPGWDSYFMVSLNERTWLEVDLIAHQTLASLASHRSNCMKRRVGAILVREKRIVSTGFVDSSSWSWWVYSPFSRYNGTPRFLKNCNEGGCGPCNSQDSERECICIHAEENAISEAGRERVGDGAVLYCNTWVLTSAYCLSYLIP